MKRVFLALPLAGFFGENLRPFLKEISNKITNVRWIRPEQFHLTLHFFGPVSEDEIKSICLIAHAVAEETAPVDICFSELGFFPNPKTPNIIWLGPQGPAEPILTLQRKIEERLAAAGFSSEKRIFKPHATIGRVRTGKKARWTDSLPTFHTPMCRLEAMVLYESHLGQGGSRYEILETFPFSLT